MRNLFFPRTLDTLLDIVYIGIDIYNIATDMCSRGEHIRSLGLDLLGMMLPYATGLGKAYRVTKIHAPCFVEGTLVETESGLKSIEDVKVGDLILSRDEKTGERSFKKAVATYETPDQRIIEIQLESEDGGTETIGATAEHPFWVKARGWVGAGDLLPGDEVFTSQGGWIRVSGSTWRSKRQTVYNLEVEDYHTYFVGEFGAWVHNMCAMKAVKKGVFPKNADDLLSGLPRNKKGHIFPSDRVRIRPEQHHLKPGETYSPRHHGQHYHVEIRNDVNKSWNNKKNVIKVKPDNYVPREGTGFLPGEKYPGL